MSRAITGLGDIALQVSREKSRGSEGKGAREPNIIEFIEADWGLGVKTVYPVQKVILKAFYGIPLDEKKKYVRITDWRRENERYYTEADYLRYLFDEGRSNVREVKEGDGLFRRELVLPIGRRSGKTELSSWIANYETDRLLRKENPQKYYGIAQGDAIKICAVATSKDQAAILYGKAKSHFQTCPRFAPYRANNTTTYYRFQTDRDIQAHGRYGEDDNAKASIQATFYSCVAKGLRGHGNIVIILDEIAHFTGTGQSSAREVYKAVTPSTVAFSPKDENGNVKRFPDGTQYPKDARIILISSPWSKEGFFYEKFREGFQRPEHMLCIQAPTWEVNPTISGSDFENEYLTDPKSFFVEFGAEFDSANTSWIEKREDLLSCIDPTAKRIWRAPSRRPHFLGLDVGVTAGGDGTAVAVGHIEKDQSIVLDYLEYVKAGEGEHANEDRLDFDWIADWIKEISRRFHIVEGVTDRWSGIPFEQALHKRGLKMIESTHFSQTDTTFMFKTFKDMMWAGKIRLYNWIPHENNPQSGIILNHEDGDLCGYIEELLSLQEKKISRNISKIEAPRVDGQHDDRSDALVRMVWLAAQRLGSTKFISGGRSSSAGRAAMDMRRQHRMRKRRNAYLGGSHPSRQVRRGKKIR